MNNNRLLQDITFSSMLYPAAHFCLFTKTILNDAYHCPESLCFFPALTHNDEIRTILDSGCHNLHNILCIDTAVLVLERYIARETGCHPNQHTRGAGMKAG